MEHITTANIFMDRMPLKIIEQAPGRLTVSTTLTDELMNPAGTAHGGILASLLDIAVTVCAGTPAPGAPPMFGVTLSLTVNYLKGIGPGPVRCTATATGGGRRTKFVDAAVFDDNGATVATATATIKLTSAPDKGLDA